MDQSDVLMLLVASISGTIDCTIDPGLRKLCLGIWTSLNFSLKFLNNFVVELHGVLKKNYCTEKVHFSRHGSQRSTL